MKIFYCIAHVFNNNDPINYQSTVSFEHSVSQYQGYIFMVIITVKPLFIMRSFWHISKRMYYNTNLQCKAVQTTLQTLS